ncbi:chloride channel protein 2 isoform X2 [Agrilus planipennis]|uniref:Chloride channel protein 2 isoform X2 n=1 Tax=Agrilus planipennis TaxID=224129 RepID=A0A1W4XVD9_AGRPL|nr:chloride channel protein 2 isoform X2 [Agrilus planipennis]XP_018336752.1 chloride channel protein 2 isoform X2 [Agrilus planipennis]XP_018336757.1 chloride channel protein 2 isoform X2 [Agrilus planipennis]
MVSSKIEAEEEGLGFQNTVMYGRYSRQLGEFAKLEALKQAEKRRLKEEKARKKELHGYHGKFAKTIGFIWRHTFAKLGEDWIFLAILGVIMAFASFITDKGISMCNKARIWLYRDLAVDPVTQYFSWISLPVCLVLFGAGFSHLVAPQSIGSGIPEMKTILRGVALKEYLTFRTLVAKVVGLIATLGSGLPLGKEGPFVHIASIVATILSKLVTGFKGIYENESRNTEMLAAACAVGVGSCFAAPVGGVLFSIEVTTVYFAVRNYWRGFFAAVCGATVFRLLSVWFDKTATVTAIFRTNFQMDFPFDPQELFVFALIGTISGLGGAFYVWVHRQYVTFMRKSKLINSFLQENRFLYPGLVALLVTTVSCPLGFGQFIAGDLTTHEQVTSLFSNFTWTGANRTVEEHNVIQHWESPYTGIYTNLFLYIVFTFIGSIICSTIPLPSGIFIPVFKIGAALGRMVGEGMHDWFPMGLNYGGHMAQIIPGGYATVGAAAFSGAVTHTISVSVIIFEMTGQITHIIPIMIAVLISNAVASFLTPSIYDSIILIKKLPYLPDFLPSSSGMYNVYVEDFMLREVKYIYNSMTYEQLKSLLKENRKLKTFPLVDNPDSMILLGSVQRFQLIDLIEKHIGRERRLQVAAIRQKEAQEKAREEALKKTEEKQRRPSRFHVSPAAVDALNMKQMSENHLNVDQPMFNPVYGSQPKKSILKKTNSFTLRGFNPLTSHSPGCTPYTTVTGAESRLRLAFENIFRKSTQLQDVDNSDSMAVLSGENGAIIVPTSPTSLKKVQLPNERVCDMTPEDQKAWEEEQMQFPVDFCKCHIDPAPFQLVERTSLLKVHSLFSMVGINIAYVTAIGKLIGVVGLKELRRAIEDANAGVLNPQVVEMNTFYNANITSIPINDEKDEIEDDEKDEKESDPNTALMSNNNKKDSEC